MKSLAHQFLDFCRSKPADEVYDAGDKYKCALAQFGYPGITFASCERHGFPSRVYAEAVHADGNRTFGALASRLEKALAQ